MRISCFIMALFLLALPSLHAQRSYKTASVLATGNWYKIAVKAPGVYKVDVALLGKLGINTANIPSATIRLFGNSGAILPEACNGLVTDDLVENALQVVDGGDGVLNGNDYFLFYAPGPDAWLNDSANQRFTHRQNIYSNQSYYFISIGGTGRRVQAQTGLLQPTTSVNSFSERYFHELDSINFLNSGKDWYGEEFSTLPGGNTSHVFNIPLLNIVSSQPATLVSACVARSVGSSSRFTALMNGQPVLQQDIAAVGNTNLDLFAKASQQTETFTPPNSLSLTYNFTPGGSGAQGWIDWFEIFCRKTLSATGNEQLLFRDWNSVAAGAIPSFTIQNAAAYQVWDITNAAEPMAMATTINGSDLSFVNTASSLHEYIAFSAVLLSPQAIGAVPNQNLHNSQPADLLIVAYPTLLLQAQRLALFHQQKDNLKTVVVTTDQVFNEFSSGTPDPTAIRDFVKMYYDKAGTGGALRPRYLLLFGDASFDYKDRLKNNSNFVPAYENSLSLDPLSTYTSDDYFGFLDDNEDINATSVTNLLDIGIGRIPARTAAAAAAYVDKLLNYTDARSLGPWRNETTFIADDQDQNLHLNDAEAIAAAAASANPLFIQNKIYLDAYTQTSTPAGSRYPDVNQAINSQVQQGTLIWNYNGHGSYTRLAEEVVLEKPIVDTWNNPYRLPLFITATCDFAPYDNPAINSLGENILLREKTGAIALMTTTRLVFAFSNRIMNRNYLQAALQPGPDGSYPSLGTAVQQAKNFTYQTQTDIANNRKFTLLGDPALTLAYPKYRVQTTSINGRPVTAMPDTLQALQNYTVGGYVTDPQGSVLNSFNGTLYATVFDKAQTIATHANDADSYVQNFQVQRSIIFKGKASVVNGKFALSFTVPQDINYQLGNGRISYYADDGHADANGSFNGFLVGGSKGVSSDNTGPAVKAWLDDTSFFNGALVQPAPVLLLRLADSSGINITGTGIGHDLTAVIDSDNSQTYVLNGFFEGDLDSYRQGTVNFQLPELAEGAHTLTIKAWDAANNSTEMTIRLRVPKKSGLSVFNVVNYPNPFTTHTSFRFDHNRPNTNLQLNIQLFTLQGKLVKTISETINTSGSRSSDIDWQGMDESGRKLPPGYYIYRLQVSTAVDAKAAVKSGKLLRL